MNSMTGFGHAALRDRGLDLEVEIRSVNHRFLLVKLAVPDGLSRFETEIEQLVRSALARGSVNVGVTVRSAEGAPPALPEPGALKAVARALREARKALKLEGDLTMADLLAVPGLWQDRGDASLEPHWPKLRKLVGKALEALSSARAREGEAIGRDLRARLDAIEGHVERIRTRVPLVIEAYQKRLEERIRQLLEQRGMDAARPDVLKEVALHADRCDTSEECQRLKAHVEEFRKILASKGPVGRRLDFLAQEMGREINTTASKGNDAEISLRAVEMKAELEKIKEQVENLE
jgi:uncharacterized protein (TIGR00255 family)